MEPIWETARYQLAVMSAGVCAFLTFFNLIYAYMRLVRRRHVSSVPLIGSGFGIVALIAIPASLPWGLILSVLAGFLVVEYLNCVCVWPTETK